MLKVPKDQKLLSASHRYSPKQEKQLSKKLGANQTKGSGSGMYDKADLYIPELIRIECKSTLKKSFAISRELLGKVFKACNNSEVPMLQIDFINEDQTVDKSCYVIEAYAMEILIEKARDNERK